MDTIKDLGIKLYQESDGSYYAEVTSLPGCFSAGETLGELEIHLQEAIESHILSLQKDIQNQKVHLSHDDLTHA